MSDGSFDDTHAHYTHDRTDTSTATPNAPRVPPTASFVDHTYPTTSCADQSHSSTVLTSPAPPVGSVLVGLVAHPPRSAVFRTVDSCERPPSTSELGAGPRQACGGDTRPLPHLLQPSGASSVANPSPRPHATHRQNRQFLGRCCTQGGCQWPKLVQAGRLDHRRAAYDLQCDLVPILYTFKVALGGSGPKSY